MGTVEWFIVGGIIIAAIDQIIALSPLKSNSSIQLVLDVLKMLFKVKKD